MDRFDLDRRRFIALVAGASALLVSGGAGAGSEPIAVVMGAKTSQHSLSLDKLRRIFLASPTDDDDGHRFVPLNHSRASAARETFDRRVLGMSPEEVARYWIDQRLRGRKPPQSVASIAMLRRALEELPGTISYLPLGAVESLRVLAIDGHLPSDASYPIR